VLRSRIAIGRRLQSQNATSRNAELHFDQLLLQNQRFRIAIGLGAGNSGTIYYVEKCDFEQVGTISSPVSEGSGNSLNLMTAPRDPFRCTGLDAGLSTAKPNYAYTGVFSVADVVVWNSTCGAGSWCIR
jgi:pectate lyase